MAASLLLEKGYEVKAFFLKIWSDDVEDLGACPWVEDRKDALSVAAKLGIPITTLDFEKDYKEEVFSYFVREYKAGRTPNPDILCNEVIKFGRFLEYALQNGADYIATGHHARRFPEEGNSNEEIYHLLAGIDPGKDQSYFLAGLNQHQLGRSLFPIGHMTKKQVREKARELNLLNVADKRSTRGICFIGKVDLKKFLEKYTIEEPGDIVDEKGGIIGRHQGVAFYTIGQRKKLEIPAVSPESKPYYVVAKDAENNQLIVTNRDIGLLEDHLYCRELRWIDGKIRVLPLTCSARIRYHQPLQEVVLSFDSQASQQTDTLLVKFKKPQRAIAPGQIIAFYEGEELIGSAVIS